jgi:hypothetical protein
MNKKKIALLVLTGLILVLMAACGQGRDVNPDETAHAATQGSEAEETEIATTPAVQEEDLYITIETRYLPLQLSMEHKDLIQHREVIEDDVAVEIFYMLTGEAEKELFRVYFGNEEIGDIIGTLETETGEIPVTASGCVYSPEDFADEEQLQLYYSMMGELNTVIQSIQNDSRFKAMDEIETPVVNTTETQLKHWKVSLPENMEVEETENGNVYQVDFYGLIAGEKLKLYTIYLGETQTDTVLGGYMINGEVQSLCVESFELVMEDYWSEQECTSAYTMLDSINNVIQTIVSSENFVADVPQD